ncbi:unnamed protein product, partial [marine sediment metagenome]
MKQEKISFKSNGLSVVGIIDIPKKVPAPGIIVCHGGTNDKINCPCFPELPNALVKAGYIVLRFDFYGSGESDGLFQDKTNELMMQNIKDAISFLSKDARVTKIGLWGRSIIGNMLAYLVDKRIVCRVIQSGVYDFTEAFERYYKKDFERFLKNPKMKYMVVTSDSRKVNGEYA